MTTVVNIRKESCDVYIGRKKTGMHFGNPFTHLNGIEGTIKVGSRAEAILCFELWIDGLAYHEVEQERRAWILEHLEELRDKKLGCFCAPDSCHGEVYVRILARSSVGRERVSDKDEVAGSNPAEPTKDEEKDIGA